MSTKQISVQRLSLTTSKPFKDVVAGLESRMGHPDMSAFRQNLTAAQTEAGLEKVVQAAAGSCGLVEFTRFDLGEVLRRELGSRAPQSLRLVVGNPVMMKQMLKFVPDAGSYAPMTILVDEPTDGVHISYDEMASFVGTHGSPEALQLAKDLDRKVEGLGLDAAGWSLGDWA
jgi:uncharacterized protein (DUF302 family)